MCSSIKGLGRVSFFLLLNRKLDNSCFQLSHVMTLCCENLFLMTAVIISPSISYVMHILYDTKSHGHSLALDILEYMMCAVIRIFLCRLLRSLY